MSWLVVGVRAADVGVRATGRGTSRKRDRLLRAGADQRSEGRQRRPAAVDRQISQRQ